MHGRLRAAFRAGLTTLLLGLLCTAALAAPRLAAEQGFSHTHPHGTEGHLHPFKLLLGHGAVPTPDVAVSLAPQVSRTQHPPASLWRSADADGQPHSRAPPV